jgi:hypothetical protein
MSINPIPLPLTKGKGEDFLNFRYWIYKTLSPLIPLPLTKGKGEDFLKRGFAPLRLSSILLKGFLP